MKIDPRYMVIPSAGLGTRMKSVDPVLPKEMLPLGGKPAIHFAVMEGLSAGIKEIIIIINRKKEMIRRYFEEGEFKSRISQSSYKTHETLYRDCSFSFLYQEEPRGESDAISLAEDIVGDNPVAVIYPDNIYLPSPGALQILASVFRIYRKDVWALMKVTEENITATSDSGRVDLDEVHDNFFRITQVLPKKDGNFVPRFEGEFRTCGISILGPGYFDIIRRARENIRSGEFTDHPVREYSIKAERLYGYLLPGTVFDIGNPAGYRLCREHMNSNGSARMSDS